MSCLERKKGLFTATCDQPETTTTCILVEISKVYVSRLRPSRCNPLTYCEWKSD